MRIWKAKVISMKSGKYVNTSPRCENVYRIVNNLIPWILISHKQDEKICRKIWRYIFTYVDKYMCKNFNTWDTWIHQAMVEDAHLMQTTKKHSFRVRISSVAFDFKWFHFSEWHLSRHQLKLFWTYESNFIDIFGNLE